MYQAGIDWGIRPVCFRKNRETGKTLLDPRERLRPVVGGVWAEGERHGRVVCLDRVQLLADRRELFRDPGARRPVAGGVAGLQAGDGLEVADRRRDCWVAGEGGKEGRGPLPIPGTGRSIGCPYLREYVDYGDVVEHGFAPTWQHPLYRTLRSGDVSVEGSETYADYRSQLLSWEECEPLVADYCQELGIPDTASSFVDALRRRR